MMFLQYAIWGAWLPLFFPFMINHRAMAPDKVGNLIAFGAVGALFAPFIAGQIADRWFNTERFLAISHIVGAVLVWFMATAESYWGLAALSSRTGRSESSRFSTSSHTRELRAVSELGAPSALNRIGRSPTSKLFADGRSGP